MADPIIPGGIRAHFEMPGRTGLPEDKYVTTFAFRTVDNLPPSEQHLQAAADVLGEFYAGVTAPGTQSIANMLGAQVNKPQCVVKVYRLGDAPPRQPFIVPKNLGANSATEALPAEVALVCSFYAGRNLPRRRGRIYIGPLQSTDLFTSAQTGTTRPTDVVKRGLVSSMKRLQASAQGVGLRWCVLSQADANLKDITAGWVDDAVDTQRRRGEGATSRLVWDAFTPL